MPSALGVATLTALGVPELLENTLSHLYTKDIVRAAAVSHHWREIIGGSATLQQELFIRPFPNREWKLRMKEFGEFKEDWYLSGWLWRHHERNVFAQLHPAFLDGKSRLFGGPSPVDLAISLHHLLDLSRTPVLQPMFIVQPPCSEVELKFLGIVGGHKISLVHAEGIRFSAFNKFFLGDWAPSPTERALAFPDGTATRTLAGRPVRPTSMVVIRFVNFVDKSLEGFMNEELEAWE